jgi:N-acetylmuramoyl-L-alanine amidase
MKKALLFLPTILLGLTSWNLPKVNTSAPRAGKIIKAGEFATANPDLSAPGDSLIQAKTVFKAKGGVKITTIVIDPGHGGHDPGCSGAHSREKHLALAIGKYFAEGLRQNFPDVKVVMTRSTDVFIPLHERAAIATREKADLFVSIHCNYIPKASHIHGTETYVLGLHATEANLEVAKRENSSILYEDNYQETYGYDPNSPEAHIVFSMFQNAFLEQSILFAQKVQKRSTGEAGRRDRGVKQAGFLVLRHATMPSVLVETGYLSNRDEENYLRTEKGQKEMANALLEAFEEYKNEMEGGEKSTPLVKLDLTPEDKTENVYAGNSSVSGSSEAGMVLPVKAEPVPAPAQKEKISSTGNSPVLKNEHSKTNISPAPAGKIIPSTPISGSNPPSSQGVSQNTDIQYRVQLAASPSLIDITQGKWKNVDYLIEVVQEGNLYKYQVRNFATLGEANSAKQKLRAIGFNDAFVAAYQNGQRI